MRRAQEGAVRSRDYYKLAQQILTRLRELTDVAKHPLFAERPIKSRLYVFMTSDRGLAGAYNSNLFKQLVTELKQDQDNGVSSKVIVIGKKGARMIARLEHVEVIAAYPELPEQPQTTDMQAVLEQVVNLYIEEQVDAVDVIFTDFKSSISQIVTVLRLLPAAYTPQLIEQDDTEKAIFEPSPEQVLEAVSHRLVEVQLWQAVLEAQASEHSMRMLAMKTATDNATELVDDLTLELNTARQASITQELAEITGGSEAIK